MPSCEICGKKYDNLNRALVEGVIIDVCGNCGKFGKVFETKKIAESQKKVFVRKSAPEESIVDNYNEIIKKAREKKGLKQEELAKEIAEKESIIHKIETGSLKPSVTLARKLEQFLNIKIIEIIEDKKEISFNSKDGEMTIGDLLKVQKRKI